MKLEMTVNYDDASVNFKDWKYSIEYLCRTSDSNLFYTFQKKVSGVSYDEFLAMLRDVERELW